MSDAVIIVVATGVSSIVSIVFSQVVAGWIAKRKTDVEIVKVQSDTNLSEGDLILKYQKIAMDQADENAGLFVKIKQQEAEKNDLLMSMKSLRDEMLLLDQQHNEEITKLKESFAEERKESMLFKSWAARLVFQIQSWNLQPVPFDVEDAKQKGLFLGDIGKGHIEDKKE